MHYVLLVIYAIVLGTVAGYIARLLVPGEDSYTLVQTIVIGIVGSLVGGFVFYALFKTDADKGAFQTGGLIGSIVGAVLVVVALRLVKKQLKK